jgi:hypothetical protein
MSQIRSDILYQRKRKEVIQANQQMKRLHIATPIIPGDDIDEGKEFCFKSKKYDKLELR